MLNSPILDVTIGLVFVFLLYSLLVTSVNEAIASTFALRARMLKNAITERMLSDVSTAGRWSSIWKGFVSLWMEVAKIIFGSWGKEKVEKKLGDKFYDHPLIRNYSSSRVYPTPSYIPKSDFSNVLVDVLKEEFEIRKSEIVAYKMDIRTTDDTEKNILQHLEYSPDIVKIKEVIDYYGRSFAEPTLAETVKNPILDRAAWEVIGMHLNNSHYDIDKFVAKLEKWFDDTMDRVSGWYKRQTQFILFCLGLVIAIMFNVDSIGLANKLSTNTDLRKLVVEEAISYQKRHEGSTTEKSDVRLPDNTEQTVIDSITRRKEIKDSIALAYTQKKIDAVMKLKKEEIDSINSLLGLGWGDYGMKRDSAEKLEAYFKKCDCDTLTDAAKRQELLKQLYDEHWFRYKVSYVIGEAFQGRRLIGFLLTAFALSLGAPFWFDMLNKLIKLRNSGVKEDSSSREGSTVVNTGKNAPVIINNILKEEAQG